MALSDVVGLYRRNTLATQARRRRHRWPDRAAAFANLHQRGMFRGWTDAALQAYVDAALRDTADGQVELKCRPEREAEIFGSYPRQLWSTLRQVQTPVTVLYGSSSFPFVAESVRRWQAVNTAIHSEQLPGSHCFMQQAPVLAAARIRDLLLGN